MTDQLSFIDNSPIVEKPLFDEANYSVCSKCNAKYSLPYSLGYCLPCFSAMKTERERLRRSNPLPADHVCPICDKSADEVVGSRGVRKTVRNSKKRSPWHLDHDHLTGEFRGYLCNNCNVGLGMLQDCPVVLDKAIAYLNAHNGHS